MMQTAIDKLRELRALHEDGLLSRQEFDSRKNAILDAAYPASSDGGAPAEPSEDASPFLPAGTEIGLMAGQEVGPFERRYRLERLIAQGGMGQVWQALDLATQAELGHSAQVALKILPPQLTENSVNARLLVEEAARARQLAHQHIVRVYDWAQDPATGSYFIIMECLDGEDLDSLLLREGPLDLARTLALLAPVADALEYAWERHRLIHRDIKPANLFLGGDGQVKLLDFGIAASARAGSMEAPASSGTAGYRAPEAGRQDRAPGRALDVYAVAVMVYRMLAGRLPFGALRDPQAQAERPPLLGDAAWAALQAGFARDPGARPDSVRALLACLAQADPVAPPEPELDAAQAAREAERKAQEAALQAAKEAARDAAREAAKNAAKNAAIAAARAVVEQQRREQEKLVRQAEEAARLARKEALRRQLAERRAAEVEQAEKVRLAQEEAQRKQVQARAAAAYLAQQKRAQAEPTPAQPPAPDTPAAGTDDAAGDKLLRDKFLEGDLHGPELVPLPTGRFQMGSPEHERKIAMAAGSQPGWLARELPQHWVGIERPIAMGRYPVLVGEWRVFVRATGWRQGGEVDWDAPGFAQSERHPVVGVSWFDALAYTHWLSGMTGRRYRLPSEAEWEYACRAGTRTAFSFGDTISPEQANYDGNFTYNGGPRGAYRRGTSAAGMFAPNPWGLCDMHGNVWEWVQDVVHENYEGAPLDGSAWELGGDQARRILRGGSWLYNPRYLRSALRNGFSAMLSNDIVGFRVVRELV